MSSLVATPPASLESDPELAKNVVRALRNSGLDHTIPKLDPFHPDLSSSDRYEILKARYEQQLLTDGLETGHFVLNDKGEIDEIILYGLGIQINEKKYNGSLITTISV